MEILVVERESLNKLDVEEALRLSVRYHVQIVTHAKGLVTIEGHDGLRQALRASNVKVWLWEPSYGKLIQALLPAFDVYLEKVGTNA